MDTNSKTCHRTKRMHSLIAKNLILLFSFASVAFNMWSICWQRKQPMFMLISICSSVTLG